MSNRRKRGYDEDGPIRSKKRRSSETAEIEQRLESLIMRVGEKSSSSLESNLDGLASVLEADLTTYKAKILKILSDCAIKAPDKCTIYTTLIGLLNTKNYNFGGECVDTLMLRLRDCLKNEEWEEARYALRFIADLVNCHVISAASLLQLLITLAETVLEEGVPQVRRDFFAFAVLSALPWVGRELYEKKESELDRMLGSIEVYMKRRDKSNHLALKVFTSDLPHAQEEYLECLWHQIKRLRNEMWIEKHISRPYMNFDSVLCQALQHNLSPLVPPPHNPTVTYPVPRVVFRMFDYTDCPEGPILPGQHSIERFLIEEQLLHVLRTFHLERKDCAAHLLSFPLKNKIPLEYMIVEVLFGELFRLPNPEYIEICYGSVLIELCKLQPSTMPQVLAQATELLYDRLDTMNVACFDRFGSWFAYHLSNFQFRWSWEDWEGVIAMEREAPKPKFITEVIHKSIRLSYHQRVIDAMPTNFKPLHPPVPGPSFRFKKLENVEKKGDNTDELSDSPADNFARERALSAKISDAIRNKCSEQELLSIIKTDDDNGSNNDGSNDDQRGSMNNLMDGVEQEHCVDQMRISVFVETLLNMGNKSLSHSFSAIAKFHSVLKNLAESEESQMCVLRSLFSLWHSHPQMMIVLVDKLLKTQIVTCAAVANWIFSREMVDQFTKMYVWEILHLTIKKMNQQVNKLAKESADARSKQQQSTSMMEENEEDEENDDQQKSKLNEEELEKLEEKVVAAKENQKNLFLIIFQVDANNFIIPNYPTSVRFIMILSEHLVRCDTDNVDFNTHWFHWTIGRLQQVFLIHHKQVEQYSKTLETLLFTQDLDPHILEVFQRFLALRM